MDSENNTGGGYESQGQLILSGWFFLTFKSTICLNWWKLFLNLSRQQSVFSV